MHSGRTVKISDNPNEVRTHYELVTPPNRRGQGRFRCLRCSHEFECSGKGRLVTHVLGEVNFKNRVKHVRPCSNPYKPLQDALLRQLGEEPSARIDFKSLLGKRDNSCIDNDESIREPPKPDPQYQKFYQTPHPDNVAGSTSNGIIKKVGRRASHCIAGIGRFPKEKILSFVETMQKISPQIFDVALMIEETTSIDAVSTTSAISHQELQLKTIEQVFHCLPFPLNTVPPKEFILPSMIPSLGSSASLVAPNWPQEVPQLPSMDLPLYNN